MSRDKPDYGDEFVINGIRLVLTCWACPEQYDAFDERGRRVGYLRLRHGTFRVTCPDAEICRETVLLGEPAGDGRFDDNERMHWLTKAVDAINGWTNRRENAQ